MAIKGPFISLIVIFALTFDYGSTQSYHGKSLGKLSELHHGVSGEVFAVDSRTLYIKDFTYDGQGPAAYFYASTKRNADSQGFRLRDEKGSGEVIRRYRKEGVTLTLPEGKTLDNIRIFYVWCEEFDVNFGDVKIPRNFDYPRPLKIEALRGVHGVSSDNIVIVDAQTLLIPNLSYDGAAPDAKFWVGSGPKPSPQGIRVPDENGKEVPLRKYNKKTVVLTLPGDLTIFEIGHFGIWCEAFTVDFGHVQIPQQMNVPPSLKMLGVSPQKRRIQQTDYIRGDGASKAHSALIGGNQQPTTYRPSIRRITAQRRSDNFARAASIQQNVVNRDFIPQTYLNSIQNQQLRQTVHQQQYQQQEFIPQPFQQQYYHQENQPLIQQRSDQNYFNAQPIPFHYQQQYENRRQDAFLENQLNIPQNRFSNFNNQFLG